MPANGHSSQLHLARQRLLNNASSAMPSQWPRKSIRYVHPESHGPREAVCERHKPDEGGISITPLRS